MTYVYIDQNTISKQGLTNVLIKFEPIVNIESKPHTK
jgi:hypothetical protein